MPEKIPFIQTPEVRGDEELQEALATEQLVFDYKVRREEMLSIFDELKENLNRRLKLEDLKKLWNEDRRAFLKELAQSIREKETQKVMAINKEDQEQEKSIQEEIQARTVGKTTRLAYLLKFRFERLNQELEAMTEDEKLKIQAYGRANLRGAREALTEIKDIKEGIKVGKSAKTPEFIRSAAETGAVYETSEEGVREINTELEDIFHDEFGGKFKLGIEEKYDEVGNIVDKEFLAAYVNYHREMKNMHDLLNRGRIVPTAYTREIMERALPALKKNPPTIVYFHGDFGTGKTALAVHLAKTELGKEPIIVSGSKYLDPDRFTEEFRLQKLSAAQFLNQIAKNLGEEERIAEDTPLNEVIETLVGTKGQIKDRIIQNWLREGFAKSLSPDEREQYRIVSEKVEGFVARGEEIDVDTIAIRDIYEKKFEEYTKAEEANLPSEKIKDIETEINNVFANPVQGRYILGAMYQAMQEGRPLIIDEANAISPDVLIAFNDLLTRKIGERIKVRGEEGEIVIRDGYCVMWTGNTGERYKQARFNDMDPASYSRIVPIQVRYLPQSRDIDNMNQLMERLNLDRLSEQVFTGEQDVLDFVKRSKEGARADQIFQVMVVKLLNNRLGAELLVRSEDRYSLLKDIYRLSVGARIIMDIFEGQLKDLPHFSNLDRILGSGEATVIAANLKKSNLTMRELIDNIIGGYLNDGGAMDIEFYLWNFIKKFDMYPKEQAILYAILNKALFFQDGEGWPNYQQAKDLNDFSKMMDFDPLDAKNGITKYKKIQKNGEYVSLLNTNGQYRLDYFSSPEILQILFGFLPPRKKEEYQEVLKRQKEVLSTGENEEKMVDLIGTIREIRSSLSPQLFDSAQAVRDFLAEINPKMNILLDEVFLREATDEQFIEKLEEFSNAVLSFLRRENKISQEEFEAAEKLDPEAKANFIAGVFRKIKDKNS